MLVVCQLDAEQTWLVQASRWTQIIRRVFPMMDDAAVLAVGALPVHVWRDVLAVDAYPAWAYAMTWSPSARQRGLERIPGRNRGGCTNDAKDVFGELPGGRVDLWLGPVKLRDVVVEHRRLGYSWQPINFDQVFDSACRTAAYG